MNSEQKNRQPARLDGRIAVVTGAAGGLGAAIARRLAELGANVVLLDLAHAQDGLRQAAQQLPGRCLALACDIADEASVRAAAASVKSELGGCGILVNNAGVLALTRHTAVEWGPRGIRTNAVSPGFINGQDLVVDGGFLETPLMHAQPAADQYGGHRA